jgi:hypothetical protein
LPVRQLDRREANRLHKELLEGLPRQNDIAPHHLGEPLQLMGYQAVDS